MTAKRPRASRTYRTGSGFGVIASRNCRSVRIRYSTVDTFTPSLRFSDQSVRIVAPEHFLTDHLQRLIHELLELALLHLGKGDGLGRHDPASVEELNDVVAAEADLQGCQ